MEKVQKIDTNADILRIFASLTVFIVHFFLNTEYYFLEINTPTMMIATCIRQFAMCCVPLFLMLTGYLYSGKEIEFNKSHILKLTKVLIPYTIITILTFLFVTYTGINANANLATMLFGFENNGYTWYIEAYLGIYLLIPFLNIMYNNLKSKNQKQILVGIFATLCFLPSLVNITGVVVFMDYWKILMPIAYYFVGVYLKEYPLKLNKRKCFVILVVSEIILSILGLTVFKDNLMEHQSNGYGNLFNAINSILIFSIISKINTDKLKDKTKTRLSKLSNRVLSAYMISYIVDKIFYLVFLPSFAPTFEQKVSFMPICIITIFVFSFMFGSIIEKISNLINKLIFKKIRST